MNFQEAIVKVLTKNTIIRTGNKQITLSLDDVLAQDWETTKEEK